MDFSFKNGPWKELFKGKLEGHSLEIYTNPDLLLLTVLVEEEGGKPIGLVIEIFRAFNANGELEAFISALPKEAIALMKHNQQEETSKFLLLSSKPSYCEYEEEKADREIDRLIEKLKIDSKAIVSVADVYGMELQELKECSEQAQEAFFAQPLMMQMISRPAEKKTEHEKEQKMINFGTITLGLTKDGIPSKEPMAMLKKTIISEGKKSERMHAMHILLEGCMLSGATAIIIGKQNPFSGLSNPTRETFELQKFKTGLDPIGFPLREFFLGEMIKIDVSKTNPKGFPEIFGLGETEASKKISETIQAHKTGNLHILTKKISEEATDSQFNEYQKHSALRFLSLIESIYPELFGETTDIEEIIKGGVRGIGRANALNMQKFDERAELLALDYVTNAVLDYFSKKGSAKELTAMIFIPNSEKFFSNSKQNHLTIEIRENLKKLEKYGIGFALETEREIELETETRELAEAHITIVKGNDAGIHIKGQKVYRVQIRPGLSSCSEKIEK